MAIYHVEPCPHDMDPPMEAWVMRGADVICMCWWRREAEMIADALNHAVEIAEKSEASRRRTAEWHRRNG